MTDCLIESKKRSSGTVQHFRYKLGMSFHARKIELKRIVFPNVFYNVRDTNNLIPLSTGDVLIPIGNYDVYDLGTQLTTTLGVATTYNPITMRFNFAVPITINWANALSAGQTNLANIQLGFLGNLNTGKLENNVAVSSSTHAPNLATDPFLINIRGINGNSSVYNNGYCTFLINPNVNKSELSIEQYEFNNPCVENSSPNYLRELEISITQTDEKSISSDLLIDWYCILRIYE